MSTVGNRKVVPQSRHHSVYQGTDSIKSYPVLGVSIAATNYEEATGRVITAARARSPLAVTALAVHGVMTGAMDATHRFRLNSLDMCVPDGQPVRWALNSIYGCALSDRVYGPDLMLSILARAADEQLPVFLYGSSAEVLARLTTNLKARFPALPVAGSSPSRFRTISRAEKERVVKEIHASGAAIVFCGLGCPRQEVWAYEYREALGIPIVAVGAAFDFFAGTVRQAPKILQRNGLEWAYRLAAEPKRLWRRYLLLNPYYLLLLASQKLGVKNAAADGGKPPDSEIGYG
jgi:N-acetylglucosaminyldiphosphoundecaprenol N-acetyl-beta-D-mannosaminyltransferase